MCNIFLQLLEGNLGDETLDESNEEEICLGDVIVEANEGEDKDASNSSMISKAMEGIYNSKINHYYYIEIFQGIGNQNMRFHLMSFTLSQFLV